MNEKPEPITGLRTGVPMEMERIVNKAMAKSPDEGMQRARELDPLSLIINTEVGWMLYFGRYYNQAIEQYQKTLEMDPSFAVAHWGLGLAYQQKAMPQEAIAEFQKAIFCLILWVKFNNLICAYPAGVANGRRPKPIPLFHKRT